jgi:hypothetical protein
MCPTRSVSPIAALARWRCSTPTLGPAPPAARAKGASGWTAAEYRGASEAGLANAAARGATPAREAGCQARPHRCRAVARAARAGYVRRRLFGGDWFHSAGTCLCQGVPANSSRRSDEVVRRSDGDSTDGSAAASPTSASRSSQKSSSRRNSSLTRNRARSPASFSTARKGPSLFRLSQGPPFRSGFA